MSSTTETPAAAPPGLPNLSHRQIITILSGLMCGMFLAALDQTIVGTSIVKIANDLHGFDLQAWATTAYLVTSTIVTPIYGKLSDVYGRKPFYLTAITIFVIGSLASAFAQSMYELAAFRALQVLGVVPFLIVAEQGQKWGWGSERAIICYVVGGLGILAFLGVEKLMKDAALIPLRLFKNSTFTVAIIGGFIVGVAMFGGITMIPQFMQVVQGYTPTESGLLMLPLMGGIMVSSIVSGRITGKTGRYKVFPIIGTLLIAGGAFFFAPV